MDNEQKVFLQAFQELENLFDALPVDTAELQPLKSILSGTLKNAKNLALYDSVTHALNARAERWLVPSVYKGMAKVDIYDLRQANKVYGAAAVDVELHKLAFQFMSMFTMEQGDFVRRSPGSDEFRIIATSRTPPEMKRMLSKLYMKQEQDSLLTWDFGVGLTETEAEIELQKQRRTYRPIIIRQTILESHTEIPERMEENNLHQSWHEFNMPYEKLIDKIRVLKLPVNVEQQLIEQVRVTQSIVESIVTRDPLTGTLNGLGARWYLENKSIHGMALTDMHNMHEGNTRYGSAAIDQDLKRFSNVLVKHFPKDEGFLLFRSERAGDEFKITSIRDDPNALEDRLCTVWDMDRNHGLLTWNYGVGRNIGEAHVDLYRNRLKDTESMNQSIVAGKSTFIIVRPQSEDYPKLFKLSEDTARLINGTPIMDLHLTVQAIRNVEDFSALKARLADYSRTLSPLEIQVGGIARMNVHNQQGRLWLLVEKTPTLEKIYNDLSQIAQELGYEAYSYKSQDWLPHVKIVDLPENTSPQIKDPTFGSGKGIAFTVRSFEWTVQKGPEHWDFLDQFPFSQ
ncbi:MAG: hypothetical protein DCC56_00425 [Anaerolineae bacterium]|nr:MAG: hypothetical protein DCC56_00425 [Anaerolineae bacterium]WKZ44497.1 MAG: hypothetical protein QY302_01750 [Anaerolineales bacterium]